MGAASKLSWDIALPLQVSSGRTQLFSGVHVVTIQQKLPSFRAFMGTNGSSLLRAIVFRSSDVHV